ncbi:DUF5131 family protein [Cupriavidus agavae]|uniref:DUF5131 family protein n=1 Tax=Cupriavidus agavae TaxID=1001822 RepID=UPI00102CBA2C|nr:DUF5131 family protein [Cupriavidus agavae]
MDESLQPRAAVPGLKHTEKAFTPSEVKLGEHEYLCRHSRVPGSALSAWIASWLAGQPPSDMWFGLSLSGQRDADHRVSQVLSACVAHQFLVLDPLTGPITLTALPPYIGKAPCCEQLRLDALHGREVCDVSEQLSICPSRIELVVAGGSSRASDLPTHPGWLRSLRNECQSAHVTFVFTGWGS